ncbi:hypothetical protein [Flavobacterium rhizosphaerae]|uniref:Uncharacterized protein n=1 Tax=Flavobacterium rhizosphaerae TaxID=3163298 RepID=A0ABW8YXJ0_9FLAO
MKAVISKPFPDVHNLHEPDSKSLIEFLNANSKSFGSIEYLAAFADNFKVSNESGCRIANKYLAIEREYFEDTEAGENYTPSGAKQSKGLFEYAYELPDSVEGLNKTADKFVLLDTVKSHRCATSEKCYTCRGSGVCSSCHGRRSKVCRSCSGKGVKQETVNGTTKTSSCFWCSGDGNIDCSSCYGRGGCTDCGASGKVICSTCDGIGVYQSFKGISSLKKSFAKVFLFSEYPNLEEALKFTENSAVYDDDVIEWENENTILFDNRENVKDINSYTPELIKELKEYNDNTRIGRLHSRIENIPVTKINFSFEGEDYEIFITGENNIVYYTTLPKNHSYKQGWFTRLMNWFYAKNRKAAFMYIAAYMLKSDDIFDDDEKEFFKNFLKGLPLNESRKEKIKQNISGSLSLEEIKSRIKVVKKDRKALIFAWHCAIKNGIHTEAEESAFNRLCDFFKVGNEEKESIKHKARQFSGLTMKQMLNEYFK